jgi:hypothetical protein
MERGSTAWQGTAAEAEMPAPGPQARTKQRAFVRLEALLWARSLSSLRGTTLWLLRVIAEHVDPYGCCWLKRETLAQEAGISLRSVANGLNALERRGLIRRIGRVGRDGARIPSVVHLVAWPGRMKIPPAGHPRLGPSVKEPPAHRAGLAPGQALPRGRARAARQKKEREERRLYAEKRRKIIESALLALGPWATAENWRRLEDDTRRLIGWVERRISLERVILPVLEEMAQGPAPRITGWDHFEAAIRARAGKDGRAL